MIRGRLTSVIITLIVASNLALSTSCQEREITMDFQDSLEYRVNQMVNDVATPMPASGIGGTASANGNDAVGQVNIQTGTETKAGSIIHVTFAEPYSINGSQPFVQVIPEDVPPPANWYVSVDWNGWDIWVSTPPAPDTNYAFNYTVIARPWPMYLSHDGQPVNSLDVAGDSKNG